MPIFAKYAGPAYLLAVLIGMAAPGILLAARVPTTEASLHGASVGALLIQGGICVLANAALVMACIAGRVKRVPAIAFAGLLCGLVWLTWTLTGSDGASSGWLDAILISATLYLLSFAVFAGRRQSI